MFLYNRYVVHVYSDHQKNQVEIINRLEDKVKNNSLNFSIVSPVADFDNDPRLCLTGVHFPNRELTQQIQQQIINPLREISPQNYYYPESSLHITVKSVRVINDPPHFSEEDTEKVRQVFSETIPQHKRFKVYFYRLLLFPFNLALMGTTDPELDSIFLDLDQKLKAYGVADDKKYSNSKFFFSNMTLARFGSSVNEQFREKVQELSESINFNPYTVDSMTLLTCNAVFQKRKIIGNWSLK